MNSRCSLEYVTKAGDLACASRPSLWSDLFLSPSRCWHLQVQPCLVDRGPEPRGACPGAAGSWLCWESSPGRGCRRQIDPWSAPPCGSASGRPDRRSCHTQGSSDASSGSVSVESEGQETSGDTRYSDGGFRSVSFYG